MSTNLLALLLPLLNKIIDHLVDRAIDEYEKKNATPIQ